MSYQTDVRTTEMMEVTRPFFSDPPPDPRPVDYYLNWGIVAALLLSFAIGKGTNMKAWKEFLLVYATAVFLWVVVAAFTHVKLTSMEFAGAAGSLLTSTMIGYALFFLLSWAWSAVLAKVAPSEGEQR